MRNCMINGQEGGVINKNEVHLAQQHWAEAVVAIGEAYQRKENYHQTAVKYLRTLYAYDQGEVLFKPTLATQVAVRTTFEQALSYFVGGEVSEDRGFALRPWAEVRFGQQHILFIHDLALAMGCYFFVPAAGGPEQKAEFTFGYQRRDGGRLSIILHHSSLPYTGADRQETASG